MSTGRLFFLSQLILCFAMAHAVAVEPLPDLPNPLYSKPENNPVNADDLSALIEQDWLQATQLGLTTQSDAAGACNGVKNGLFGFHVGHQANPWWQVDLGETTSVGRVVVYNRLDYAPGLHNADTLHILTSLDGEHWELAYDNAGHHFGGISGAPPLNVTFDGEGMQARFIRLTIPSDSPVFLHLDEVEVYAADDDAINIALHKPSDQSSLSPWSTISVIVGREYPTQSYIDRGYQLAAYLEQQGVDVSNELVELDAVAKKTKQLPDNSSEEMLQALYVETRWVIRRIVFKNPILDFDRLLFTKRFTQETFPDICLNHMPWVSRPGGDLCILQPLDGETGLFTSIKNPGDKDHAEPVAQVQSLINGALGPGNVHGMDLWFEGDRIVFGYARSRSNEPPEGWLDRAQSFRLRREEQPTHLFELNLADGQIRQITSGEWSDLDPTYAPNGNIIFVSERCGTSLQCNEYDKDETSCNLYVVQPDGSGIRRLSVNKDGDYMPYTLDNGMIAFTRWEYQERGFAYIHSIWVIRPDGTGADALYGQHMENPWALIGVRSIPNSNKLIALASGHHTLAVGSLITIDPSLGINNPSGIGMISPKLMPPQGGMDGVPVPQGGTLDQDGFYTTPWALSDKFFLASYAYGSDMTDPTGYGLYLVDVYGNKELIYRDPEISCFTPIPLRERPIPHIVPDNIDLEDDASYLYVTEITHGADGIAPSDAHYLRITAPIPWPYDNQYGGHRYGEDHRYAGPDAARRNLVNWTPVRILGDVPVRPDGSVEFQVPPDTAVYFQLLDENRMELRRMRSSISFQPGEMRGCVGCHETREDAGHVSSGHTIQQYMSGPPSVLLPPWGDQPVNFLRDVQPVFNNHCIQCHSGLNPEAGLDFSAGLIAWDDEVPHYGHNRAYETILKNNLVSMSAAREHDASVTPPLAYGARNSKLLSTLSDEHHHDVVELCDDDILRITMWIDSNAPYHDQFVNKRSNAAVYNLPGDTELLSSIKQVHSQRCTACHEVDEVSRLDWIDFEHPELSLFLRAPLADSSGLGKQCSSETYKTTEDPDYIFIKSLVENAVARAWEEPRRDLFMLKRPTWVSAQNIEYNSKK